MSLHRRSLWFMVLGIAGVLVAAVAADRAFSRALADQRAQAAAAAGAVAEAAVIAEFERLDLVARDLGTGDDAARFALADDRAFRLDRLAAARLRRFGVDLVLLLGPTGEVRHAFGPWIDDELPQVTRVLADAVALRLPPDDTAGLRAALPVAGEPVLLAVRPIHSGAEGVQGRGRVIVGIRGSRWLETVTAGLATSARGAPPVALAIVEGATARPVAVRDGVARVALPGAEPAPAYALRVTPDGGGGQFVFRALTGAITLVAATVILLVWMGLDALVLRRLRALAAALRALPDEPAGPLRLPGSWGVDEVGAVAAAADTALAAAAGRADQRAAEAREATASEIFGEHVVREMAEGVLVVDADGTCRACNPVAARLLEVDPGDLLGRRDALEEYLPRPVLETAWQRAAAGDPTPQPLRRGTADVVLTAARFRRRPDAAPGLILLLRDVSAERRAERLQRGIVSVVSHELRTPLTVIDSSLTLLREQVGERLEPGELRVIELLGANAERMHELVNDLLDLSALESGELQVDFEPFDLVDLAEEVRRLQLPRSQEAGVAVEVRSARRPLLVDGDRGRLRQLLTNLLGNAVKYSPGGGHVWVDIHDRGPQGVRVDVTDTGHGIPAEDQPRIFDQFFRASNARRSSRGTGLGLAISRQIAVLHGGRLELARSDETGSTFVCALPAERVAVAPPPRDAAAAVLDILDDPTEPAEWGDLDGGAP